MDIDLPKLLTRVRAGMTQPSTFDTRYSIPDTLPSALILGLRGYARLATSPGMFTVSQKLAAFGSRVVSPFSDWINMPVFTGWGFSKDFPRPAVRSFRERFHREDAKVAKEINKEEKKEELRGLSSFAVQTPLPEQFTSELTALGGTVIPCTRTELPARLSQFLRQREAVRVFVDEVGGENLPSGFEAVREADPSIKIGLTGCAAGIANTGTVVLLDEDETLKASILPETHLVILRANQLVADLLEALALTHGASNAVLVSGPSRTADIEMTLTIGVHGPKEIVVFLVHETASTLVDDSIGGC